MGYLAEAGFDAFAMDQSGYGRSPRPMMDDPCNMSEADQALVTPSALSGPCEPSYAYGSTTVQSDWDELDTVVDFIRELRGVDRVSLVGWSAGGRRTGGYAARHPEKVDKLFLYAPGYSPNGSSEAPADLPRAGVPMRLQTHETLTQGRWQENVVCENQVDPGIRKVIWRTHHGLRCARVGVGSARRGDARADRQPVLGLEQQFAAKVKAPTMIVVGEQDNPASREVLHTDLTGTDSKVLVTMACATPFAVWETSQYKFLHRASLEWPTDGTYQGERNGVYRVEVNGAVASGA